MITNVLPPFLWLTVYLRLQSHLVWYTSTYI